MKSVASRLIRSTFHQFQEYNEITLENSKFGGIWCGCDQIPKREREKNKRQKKPFNFVVHIIIEWKRRKKEYLRNVNNSFSFVFLFFLCWSGNIDRKGLDAQYLTPTKLIWINRIDFFLVLAGLPTENISSSSFLFFFYFNQHHWKANINYSVLNR